MTNTVNVDKDILLATLVNCLGGGNVSWEEKIVELNYKFKNKKIYNTQELIIVAISEGRKLVRGDDEFRIQRY